MSYYAHVRDWDDDNGNPIVGGSTVYQGATVGHVGNTGCSGGSHLHYNVSRISNNARAGSSSKPRRYPWNHSVDVYGASVGGGHTELPDNLGRVNIDPSGWQAPSEMDPRGHAFYNATFSNFGPGQATATGAGGASINLWEDGSGYPRPCDGKANFCSIELSGGGTSFMRNPDRTCL